MTAKNWAVAIGINQYDYLSPLDYGQQDARAVGDFLQNEAKFDRILSFTDDAPDKSLRPTRNNLRRVLRQLAKEGKQKANMSAGSKLSWHLNSPVGHLPTIGRVGGGQASFEWLRNRYRGVDIWSALWLVIPRLAECGM
ncbi:caspase family protein [Oscillatoriales cyanobacterium LEGE 11467]|uniref:Caspase family protein n=1 Tax=Zarconia navalis LEGE 11467 TaxID=1828826 RepID=A0A928VXI7_9CYAN|nr:caspase family protein [Zarconia navalis]MBE9040577.1 caspase family protein [Zarconia navalis LEGE 11467]